MKFCARVPLFQEPKFVQLYYLPVEFFSGVKGSSLTGSVTSIQKAKSKMSQLSPYNWGSDIVLEVRNNWISLLDACTCIFQAFVSEGW